MCVIEFRAHLTKLVRSCVLPFLPFFLCRRCAPWTLPAGALHAGNAANPGLFITSTRSWGDSEASHGDNPRSVPKIFPFEWCEL